MSRNRTTVNSESSHAGNMKYVTRYLYSNIEYTSP